MTNYWRDLGAKYGVKFDGCTSAPDFNFTICCDEHDVHYQTAGKAKWKADLGLAACMIKQPGWKGKLLAIPYWLAVSVVGHLYYRRKQNEAKQTVHGPDSSFAA